MQELTVLGLVSLSLFIFERSGVLDISSKHDVEIIHLTLFVVAVVYAGAFCCLLFVRSLQFLLSCQETCPRVDPLLPCEHFTAACASQPSFSFLLRYRFGFRGTGSPLRTCLQRNTGVCVSVLGCYVRPCPRRIGSCALSNCPRIGM